ncbi:unannotated protein [freshwater metagenome]|uniref:Unannotated protein n=1 Tax=freshwater metagenome TaxID=449393 RepID=A0A6J6QH83_9ZZZZ
MIPAPPCSATDESLSATAPTTACWVAIEQPGPWQSRALESGGSRLPDEVARVLCGWSEDLDIKVLLIRSRHRHVIHRAGQTRRVYIAPLLSRPGTLFRLDVEDVQEVIKFDPLTLIAGDFNAPIHPARVDLVCTNGRRDICCAQLGRPLLEQLEAAGQEVWETTHIGGHRFGPVHLTLPDGRIWGRNGELRGSTHLSRIEQALESYYFKLGTDLQGAQYEQVQISDNSWQVRAWLNGKDYSEVIERSERGLSMESCNKEAVTGHIFKVKNF